MKKTLHGKKRIRVKRKYLLKKEKNNLNILISKLPGIVSEMRKILRKKRKQSIGVK